MNTLVKGLRELLLTSAKRTPAAQLAEVSRRVNLLAVQYGNLTDEQSALECVALIGLAQIKGNKDAAKKSLKFVRWNELPPPPLNHLSNDQERRGAVKSLSMLRAPWVLGYVSAALCATQQERELATDLVAWAYAASKSTAEFLIAIANAIRDGVGGNSSQLKLAQKLVLKHLSGTRLPAGDHCPEALVQLVSASKEVVSKFKIAHKDAVAMRDFVIQIIDQVTIQEPAMLLSLSTAQAIGAAETIAGTWSTGAKKHLELLSIRMLSAGELFRSALLAGAADDASTKFKYAAQVLPLEKVAKWTPHRQSLLKELLQGINANGESTGSPPASPGLLDQVAALLVAWDRGPQKLQDKTEFREIELQVNAVAEAASVERFGEHGQVVPYRPLEQSLVEPRGKIPESVKIEVPGARARRGDGSYRVLIKAIVSGA